MPPDTRHRIRSPAVSAAAAAVAPRRADAKVQVKEAATAAITATFMVNGNRDIEVRQGPGLFALSYSIRAC